LACCRFLIQPVLPASIFVTKIFFTRCLGSARQACRSIHSQPKHASPLARLIFLFFFLDLFSPQVLMSSFLPPSLHSHEQ
jgi:hypothetical protein